MRFWYLAGVTMLAMAVQACSSEGNATSGEPPPRSEATAPAGGSTVPTSTGTIQDAPSTTDPPVAIEIRPPTDFVDSFSFEYSMLEFDDEAFGIVSLGVFVTDNAVSCEAANPGLVGGSFGVGTAIDDEFWFDDGFLTPSLDDRDDEYATEWLAWCPGAPEYWPNAVYLDERFALSFGGPGDPVNGYLTHTYAVESASDDMVVDTGTVWVTDEGWPIRVEISGDVLGGVFSFFEAEGEDDIDLPDDLVPFRIALVLTEIDGPAHRVVAPDGSASVGPLGEVAASIPVPEPPSGALTDVINAASNTACVTTDSISDLVPDADFAMLEPSQINVAIVDETLSQIYPGMAYGGSPTYQVVTKSDSEAARRQAELLFNHRAPIAALFDWIEFVPPDWALDDQLHISIASSADGDRSIDIAVWDGQRIVYQDGSANDATYHAYLSVPEPDLALTKSVERDARTRLDQWKATASEVAATLSTGDLQAAADLEVLYRDLDATKAVACAILATKWVAADKAISANSSDADLYNRYVDEAAAQHLLLAIEYTAALGRYLDQSDLDWLRSGGIDLDRGLLVGDTPGTILDFFTDLLGEALLNSDPAAYG